MESKGKVTGYTANKTTFKKSHTWNPLVKGCRPGHTVRRALASKSHSQAGLKRLQMARSLPLQKRPQEDF